MNHVPIPQWDSEGVLPPFHPATPVSADRSPYPVSLTDIVLRFGDSPERQAILQGFLAFRSGLHSLGLVNGFQWLDGSFLEHVEMIEERSPRDIDVVTFFHLPEGQTQETLAHAAPRIFSSVLTKQDFRVDAYFVDLGGPVPEVLVQLSAYWYSLWSHRRTGRWKGYLQIDLSSTDDPAAKANLDRMIQQGGRP